MKLEVSARRKAEDEQVCEACLIEHLMSQDSKYRTPKATKEQLAPRIRVNGLLIPGELRRVGVKYTNVYI